MDPDGSVEHPHNRDEINTLNFTLCGSGAVGKHAIALALVENRFKTEYYSCVFDDSRVDVLFDGDPITINLRMTSGQECYDALRPLTYPITDAFIVCYDQKSQSSLNLTDQKFIPDFRLRYPNAPFLLVGTKSDVFEAEKKVRFVSAKHLGRKLGAACVLECSAKTQVGMNTLACLSSCGRMFFVCLLSMQHFSC